MARTPSFDLALWALKHAIEREFPGQYWQGTYIYDEPTGRWAYAVRNGFFWLQGGELWGIGGQRLRPLDPVTGSIPPPMPYRVQSTGTIPSASGSSM